MTAGSENRNFEGRQFQLQLERDLVPPQEALDGGVICGVVICLVAELARENAHDLSVVKGG